MWACTSVHLHTYLYADCVHGFGSRWAIVSRAWNPGISLGPLAVQLCAESTCEANYLTLVPEFYTNFRLTSKLKTLDPPLAVVPPTDEALKQSLILQPFSWPFTPTRLRMDAGEIAQCPQMRDEEWVVFYVTGMALPLNSKTTDSSTP